MILKQGFKLLNPFCFSLKDKVVLFIGQCFQICNSIIVRDSIQVMNNPSRGQGLPIGFFPNKNMLTDIPIPIGTGMFRAQAHSIAIAERSATFPVMMFGSSTNELRAFTFPPSSLLLATMASLGKIAFHWFAAIDTVTWFCLPRFQVTISTIVRGMLNHLATVWTRFLAAFPICPVKFAVSLGHIISVSYVRAYINEGLRQEFPTEMR